MDSKEWNLLLFTIVANGEGLVFKVIVDVVRTGEATAVAMDMVGEGLNRR